MTKLVPGKLYKTLDSFGVMPADYTPLVPCEERYSIDKGSILMFVEERKNYFDEENSFDELVFLHEDRLVVSEFLVLDRRPDSFLEEIKMK